MTERLQEQVMAHVPTATLFQSRKTPSAVSDPVDELRLNNPSGMLLSFPDPFPPIPALLSTRLQLDLLLGERLIDLSAVSAVILRDLGATLQVLRLFGAEHGNEPVRPMRMENCLAALDARMWFDAVCTATIEASAATPEICAAWTHAHAIAQCAREIAETMDGYSPEEACMVGLLHELEDLAALLGWDRRLFPAAASAAQMASAWNLPRCLVLCSEKPEESDRYWHALLDEAHRRLMRSHMVA
jgi:hypothetical protein